jgi:NADPH-dependent 2,4-dienoyl-CoA reductase/sulfur reductase-like enzyme
MIIVDSVNGKSAGNAARPESGDKPRRRFPLARAIEGRPRPVEDGPMTRVAIIGGGIGGLTAANALLRAGAEVSVYEAAGS